MPLNTALVERWASERGNPWLWYRLSHEQLAPWVLRSGLQPRAVTGQRGAHLLLPSRVGHVYLATANNPATFGAAGMGWGPAHFAVDIRALVAARLDSDEDKISAYASNHSSVAALPEAHQLQWPDPKSTDVSAWADANSAIIDRPDWVLHSLKQGCVAHRGHIPASLLEVDPQIQQDWEPATGADYPDDLSAWGPRMPFRRTPIT